MNPEAPEFVPEFEKVFKELEAEFVKHNPWIFESDPLEGVGVSSPHDKGSRQRQPEQEVEK